jgi:hypothetical protein
MQQSPFADERRDQEEEELWTDLISSEMDRWHPRRLPTDFRPEGRIQRFNRRWLLLILIALLLATLAIALFTGLPRGLAIDVIDLARLAQPPPVPL